MTTTVTPEEDALLRATEEERIQELRDLTDVSIATHGGPYGGCDTCHELRGPLNLDLDQEQWDQAIGQWQSHLMFDSDTELDPITPGDPAMTQAAETEPQFTPAKKGDFAVAVQPHQVSGRETFLLVRVHSADKDGNIKLVTTAGHYGRTGAPTRERGEFTDIYMINWKPELRNTLARYMRRIQAQQEGDGVPVLAWNTLFEATEDVTAIINKAGEATRTVPYTEPEATQAEDTDQGPEDTATGETSNATADTGSSPSTAPEDLPETDSAESTAADSHAEPETEVHDRLTEPSDDEPAAEEPESSQDPDESGSAPARDDSPEGAPFPEWPELPEPALEVYRQPAPLRKAAEGAGYTDPDLELIARYATAYQRRMLDAVSADPSVHGAAQGAKANLIAAADQAAAAEHGAMLNEWLTTAKPDPDFAITGERRAQYAALLMLASPTPAQREHYLTTLAVTLKERGIDLQETGDTAGDDQHEPQGQPEDDPSEPGPGTDAQPATEPDAESEPEPSAPKARKSRRKKAPEQPAAGPEAGEAEEQKPQTEQLALF